MTTRRYTQVPAISDRFLPPELVKVLRPMRELLEQLKTEVGLDDSPIMRRSDIDQLGLTEQFLGTLSLPAPKVPAPRSVKMVAYGVRIEFRPESIDYQGFEAIEVHRGKTDSFVESSYIGETDGLTYTDITGEPGAVYLYWFIGRNTSQVRGEALQHGLALTSGGADAGTDPDLESTESDFIATDVVMVSGTPAADVAEGSMGDDTLQNSTFEGGDNGWEKGTGWTISSDASNARRGEYRGAKDTAAATATLNNKRKVPVEPGDRLTACIFAKSSGSANGSGRCRVEFYSAAGASVGTSDGNVLTGPIGSYSISRVIGALAPASAVYARVGMYVTGHTAGTWYCGDSQSKIDHRSVDEVNDGATYARILGSDLTAGAHKLTVAASDKRVADARNVNQVYASNTGASFSVTSPLTASDAGATATISIAAFTLYVGSLSVSVNSGSVTGLAFSTKYYIYFDDTNLAGGAVTYVATTTHYAPSQANGRVYVGYITTPADGAGGTGGSGGGGDPCVEFGAWVDGDRQAGQIDVGDTLTCLKDGQGELFGTTEDKPVIKIWEPSIEPCVEITTDGGARLVVSHRTPVNTWSGKSVPAAELCGWTVAVIRDGERPTWELVTEIATVPPRNVAHLSLGGESFAATSVKGGARIFTHNPMKP